MNASYHPRVPASLLPKLILDRSRNRGYDSNESRRSPRDRSPAPARYNDSRDSAQPRSASYRGGEGQSRSGVDSRSNNTTFPPDRDNFRDSVPRQPSRDFSSTTGPPRGPKGSEPPTGPRASTFATDARGRGALGRGRGWHESGRDRGRDTEFDYRDRREDRGMSSFRGDRGRDRERAERRERESIAYRAARPSSPGGGYNRGRPRGRGDWDVRGYGRGFDDRDRYRVRSRTPPSRRASVASPPPQATVVPAFGTLQSMGQTASAPSGTSARISPTPPVNVPTGPRHSLSKPKTLPIQPGRFPRGDNAPWPRPPSVTPAQDPPPTPKLPPPPAPPSRPVVITAMVAKKTPDSPQLRILNPDGTPIPRIIRIPLPRENIVDDDDSESESGEDMDHYFEDETKKVQEQLALTSLGDIELTLTYASQDAIALHPVLEADQTLVTDGDIMDELEEPNDVAMAEVGHPEIFLQTDYEMGEETENEEEEQLSAIRPSMPTPSVSSLPFGPITPWWEDSDVQQDMDDATQHQAFLEQEMIKRIAQKEERNRELRREYARHYEQYLRFCDSDDPVATKYRAKVAADQMAASRAASVTPQAEGRPEGRRAGSRFTTEHDFARVLQESKREAQERQERAERAAKAKAASEKEASTPDMIPRDEHVLLRFSDRSRIVPFERAAALLGILPPVDNFTEDECEIFEKTYLEFPKQWSKIAEALPGRNYKNCIQHYYIVKHRDDLKSKLKKKEKGKKRGKAGGAGGKPKSNALMANLGSRDGEDDVPDVSNGDGERRRPRRAAAPIWPIEAPSESETTTPAPTPGRRAAAVPKSDVNIESGATKRKGKGSVTREKGAKQAKSSQLLAAAPSAVPKPREDEKVSPAVLLAEKAPSQGPPEPPRFIRQWDIPAPSPKTYPPARVSQDLHVASTVGVVDNSMMHSYEQDFVESAPVVPNFDVQLQDRRNLQTSSYWSVPEVNEFPSLLHHFGTDWQAIAKWMGTKTHIMVKNYFQRQLDLGKSEWEEMARIADTQRAKGESTGPPPTPQIPGKKRYDGSGPSQQRHAGPVADVSDDKHGSNLAQHASSPQISTIPRFQPLAQASPVPQTRQPSQPTSISSKPAQNQTPQQSWNPQTIQNRQPRLGFFNPDRDRPILQAATTTQPSAALSDPQRARRSVEVAQEAKLEREQAWRLQEQAQQQARQQQNRRMKEEPMDERPLSNIEQYSAPSQQHSVVAPSRTNESAAFGESRHALPVQQYPPRIVHGARDIPLERAVTGLAITNPPPQITRNTASAPPIHHEPPPVSRPQPPAVAAVRQQEPLFRKTSSIMSLLNDEPSDPRPQQKQISDVPPATARPVASPAPQQLLYQPGRSLSGNQPAILGRKTSLEDMHGGNQGFSRSTAPSQPPIRVVESTWSAVAQSQSRPQNTSPVESGPPYHFLMQMEISRREQERLERERREQERLERDAREQERREQERREQERREQERRQQELLQKVPVTSSQPLAPYYAPQQMNHRHVTYNSTLKVPASPPRQYGPSHLLGQSRYDGRSSQHRPAPPIQPPVQSQEMHYGGLGGRPPAAIAYQPIHHSHTSTHYGHTESPTSTQAPSQVSQQYPSQQQKTPQPSYSPLSGPPLHQHTQSSGSARPYSPLAYETREAFRPPSQQPQQPGQSQQPQTSQQSQPSLDRAKLEQTQPLRQQMAIQQQQVQQQHQQQRQTLHPHPHHQQHQHHHHHHQQQQHHHMPQEERIRYDEVYHHRMEQERRYQESRRG